MKVQSTVSPRKWEVRKIVDGQCFIKLRKNISEFTNEEGDTLFEYEEVEVVIPKIQGLNEFVEEYFDDLWNANPIENVKELRKLKGVTEQLSYDMLMGV